MQLSLQGVVHLSRYPHQDYSVVVLPAKTRHGNRLGGDIDLSHHNEYHESKHTQRAISVLGWSDHLLLIPCG